MRKWNDLQLKFDEEFFVELDEVAEDAEERAISAEEARQISEAARVALEEIATSQDPEGATHSPDKDVRATSASHQREWFGEYLKLREQGWPWRVACYIAWAASPKVRRWPETLKDLAEQVLGLKSPRVIYTWRQKYPTLDTVVAMMQAAPLWDHRRDVIQALVETARTADYKNFNDRKLFLEMVGDYTPRSRLDLGKASKDDLSELSDEELMGMIGEKGDEDGEVASQVQRTKERASHQEEEG